jgi:hypothetical protein
LKIEFDYSSSPYSTLRNIQAIKHPCLIPCNLLSIVQKNMIQKFYYCRLICWISTKSYKWRYLEFIQFLWLLSFNNSFFIILIIFVYKLSVVVVMICCFHFKNIATIHCNNITEPHEKCHYLHVWSNLCQILHRYGSSLPQKCQTFFNLSEHVSRPSVTVPCNIVKIYEHF